MKAQIINRYGPPSVFELVEIAKPDLKPGHVLIKVFATSVNRIDCKIRAGLVSHIAPAFPAILHSDVAGVIEAVGDEVVRFKVGDKVYGCAGGLKNSPGGALAEYMLADERLLAEKPISLAMAEAAALPLVSITAWEALIEKSKLAKNSNVLIHGGTGGVGHIAIQLAKWRGAKVYTTVLKNEDFAIVKSLGADEVINAKEETVEEYLQKLTQNRGFDLIFDTIGGENLDRSLLAAALNGTVVTTVARSTHDLTPMHNKALSLHVVFMLLPLLKNIRRGLQGEILSQLAEIIDEGQLKPLIDPHLFTLGQVAEAHDLVESGRAQGKVVITIRD